MIQHYAEPGSISWGTLRLQDTLRAMSDTLDALARRNNAYHHDALLADTDALLEIIERSGDQIPDAWLERCQDAAERLADDLQAYAPPLFYFGSHPGDGSDLGFWLSEYWQDDFDGQICQIDFSALPEGYTGQAALVSDHGNLELWSFQDGQGRRLWGIV